MTIGKKNITKINTDFKLKTMYVDLNTMIEYWTRKKHEGDKGGSFNLQLYLQILKAKSNEIQQRENSKTN